MTAELTPDPPLPLPALLAQALVAFTIEFDNEAERQIVHRTTSYGKTPGGVWLVSMAMWLNCMRYVSADPISVAELRRRARGGTNLAGMQRWGYITVTPGPDGRKARASEQLVRATRKGLAAQAAWEPLTEVIEERWRERWAGIGELRAALASVAGQLGSWLPDCLPILGYGLFCSGGKPGEHRYRELQAQYAGQPPAVAGLPLPWLLARVLLAFALEYEQQTRVSLATAANVVRLLDEQGVRVRDLPARSGVSVEGLSMATGFLERAGLAAVGAGPPGERWKVARLTSKGTQARRKSARLLAEIEDAWRERYGDAAIAMIRQVLAPLADPATSADGARSPLLAATDPYPDGWRASARRPQTLPYFPMVLHRGGYPDGS
jgi:DNA-binding MarR family transcriptional regulator